MCHVQVWKSLNRTGILQYFSKTIVLTLRCSEYSVYTLYVCYEYLDCMYSMYMYIFLEWLIYNSYSGLQ